MDQNQQDLLTSIGDVFKMFRTDAGLTQRQAAEKAGSCIARISNMELAKQDMLILNIQRWAKVYGYDVEINFVPIEDEGTSDVQPE